MIWRFFNGILWNLYFVLFSVVVGNTIKCEVLYLPQPLLLSSRSRTTTLLQILISASSRNSVEGGKVWWRESSPSFHSGIPVPLSGHILILCFFTAKLFGADNIFSIVSN